MYHFTSSKFKYNAIDFVATVIIDSSMAFTKYALISFLQIYSFATKVCYSRTRTLKLSLTLLSISLNSNIMRELKKDKKQENNEIHFHYLISYFTWVKMGGIG